MNTKDYYPEAHQIANILKCEGLRNEAESINNIIDAGSTGTEILMGLRFYFEEFIRNEVSSNTILMNRIKSLIKAIDKAIR